MANQSIELQQNALYRLQNYLQNFKEDLLNNVERYRNIVDSLQEEGLSNEVYNTYLHSYYERDRAYIQQLIDHIEEADAQYISRNLEQTGVSKETAGIGWDF